MYRHGGGTVSVPVRQIADIEPDWHDAQIAHRNGIPSISIQSDVKEGSNAAALTKEIVKAIEKSICPMGLILKSVVVRRQTMRCWI